MTDEKKPTDPNPSADDKATAAPKLTRRRFTKAGAVAPVIMTLGSRPVWGQTCSFSGALSGNDYATAKPIIGSAHTPSWWLSVANSETWSSSWPIKPGNPSSDKVYGSVDTLFPDVRSVFESNDKFVTVLEGGCPSIKANVAAAILDILAGTYYYDMYDLDDFIKKDRSDVLAILRCLNGCAA